jgi:pimeloyl-ACP methyl ester carboxylesterase
MEALAIVWPAYFATPSVAPAMPVMDMSLPCYSGTWESIHDHLARGTLAAHLGRVRIPTTFVLGAQSPIPPRHGMASAALIPGAVTEILPDCGHFPWLERPGVIRAALVSVQGRASGQT